VTAEQNGPVRSGRTPRITFGKQDRAVEPTAEPQESTFGLISIISAIAVALVILVAGSLVVSAIVGNANGGRLPTASTSTATPHLRELADERR
jgi:hypothetical protein